MEVSRPIEQVRGRKLAPESPKRSERQQLEVVVQTLEDVEILR